MEFVNLTMPSKGDPMDLGRVETRSFGRGGDRSPGAWDRLDEEDWEEEQAETDEDGNLKGLRE